MDATLPTFVQNPETRFRLVGEEAVVIQQRAGEVVGLNPVGSRIFELLALERTVEQLVEILASEFDSDRDRLGPDTTRFLSELVAVGLVVERPGSPAVPEA